MFPDIEVNIEELETPVKTSLGRVYLFDFETRRHVVRDGKLVECTELEAVRQWVTLLLKTKINKVKVYKETGFGLSSNNLIGLKTYPIMLLQAVLEEEIKEKCAEHVLIRSINDFEVSRTDRGLDIHFKIILKNGNTQGVTAIVN
ncbi:MAG: hypothetical protein K0S71_559 [Clostridia bacterium]|jgi:hypothetical protein|nr:hypothetical protein [Clostridia bacterium]